MAALAALRHVSAGRYCPGLLCAAAVGGSQTSLLATRESHHRGSLVDDLVEMTRMQWLYTVRPVFYLLYYCLAPLSLGLVSDCTELRHCLLWSLTISYCISLSLNLS